MEISDEFVADLKSFIDKFPSRNLLEDYEKSYGFFNFDHYFKHVSGKFIEYTENYRRAVNAKPVLIISDSY